MSITAQTIDQARLDEFMGRFVGDLGAAISAALVVIGDRLGLYRALGDGEPGTADELASRPGTDARYVREWLSNQLRAARTPHAHRLAVPAKTPAVRLAKPAGACDRLRCGRADAPDSTGRRPQPPRQAPLPLRPWSSDDVHAPTR